MAPGPLPAQRGDVSSPWFALFCIVLYNTSAPCRRKDIQCSAAVLGSGHRCSLTRCAALWHFVVQTMFDKIFNGIKTAKEGLELVNTLSSTHGVVQNYLPPGPRWQRASRLRVIKTRGCLCDSRLGQHGSKHRRVGGRGAPGHEGQGREGRAKFIRESRQAAGAALVTVH